MARAQVKRIIPGEPAQAETALSPIGSGFRRALIRDGTLRPVDLLPLAGGRPAALSPLPMHGLLAEADLLAAASRHFGATRIDPCHPLPDPALIDRIGAAAVLAHGTLPWRRVGGCILVATARPDEFDLRRPWLQDRLGSPVIMVLAPAAAIEAALHARRGRSIAHAAETRVPAAESCRNWGGPAYQIWWALAATLALLAFWAMPQLVTGALLGLALISLIACTGLKLAALLAALRHPGGPEPPLPTAMILPRVSVIVGLYKESNIAGRLVRRLARLDYPRDRLEVILAVEASDHVTRRTLADTRLPGWMRVVVAPEGSIRTKPRALNVALDQCRGSIIGVYDAEDAPEPQQLRKVVAQFHRSPPEVACLQGALDYYNPRTNWLSRCFTLEYASWFRVMLPGVARLGLVVPLGGTTLFFRRAVLQHLGGWDAHNVTEDADLGLRLCRHGYRTELVATTTLEEANCRPLHWVKQRSRWIKGYMVTWGVHMRDPRRLWHDLGPMAFLGLQVQFLGAILSALLVPVHLSFWLITFGLPSPFTLPGTGWILPLIGLYLISATVDLVAGWVALRRSGHRLSPLWLLSLHAYFPLASLAAYKALWELATRPFYWDKTSHGLFDHSTGPP